MFECPAHTKPLLPEESKSIADVGPENPNGKLIGESERDNRKEYEERLAREEQYKQGKEKMKIINRIRRFF